MPTNGGGIAGHGCGSGRRTTDLRLAPSAAASTDADCAPGLSDGTGPGLVIDANLIMGNSAEAAAAAALRLQTSTARR